MEKESVKEVESDKKKTKRAPKLVKKTLKESKSISTDFLNHSIYDREKKD